MSVPSATELLREFDRICHDERMNRLGELARRYLESPELDRLIGELEAGEVYESLLAVRLAVLAKRVAPLERGISCGSVRVMHCAAKYLPKITGSVETLVGAYERADFAVRTSLLYHIKLQGRTEAAEALFLKVLAAEGPGRAMVLLPACGPATVCEVLGTYEHVVEHWASLALRHPEIVFDQLRRRLQAVDAVERVQVWGRYREAVKILAVGYSGQLVQLAIEMGPAAGLPVGFEECLGVLTRREPDRVFELLSAERYRPTLERRGVPLQVLGSMRRLKDEHRRFLARRLVASPVHLAALLAREAPVQRASLFEYARQGLESGSAPWCRELLEVLPHRTRHQEGRRILGLKDVRSDPMATLEIQRFLPFEEARATLENAARATQADERALALHSLVRCAGLNRQGMGEVLQFCQKIENDQDPVRGAVYEALAACAPMVFEEAHIEALFSLFRHAFMARDTSWMTRRHIESFTLGLLQTFAVRPREGLFTVALDLCQELARQSRYLSLDLENRLPPGAEGPLIEALKGPLRQSVEREDYTLLFMFARGLGRRAWDSEVIQSLLEKATRAKPDVIAERAVHLWLDPPRTRDERVQKLLRRDRSAIRIRPVFEHLHRRRQDLLDPYLKRRSFWGRFLTGESIYVVPARSGFFRWLPRQERAYAALLDEIIGDEGASTQNRRWVMTPRARLLTTCQADLAVWLNAADTNIVEAALHGLSLVDRPSRSCAILAEHLTSSRARVAMYSLFRCANYTNAAVVHRVLRDILGRERLKVTVEKEVVRLLARFPTADNMELLFTYAGEGDLHRDVKIAVGHAARALLHHERAWAIVERLASDEDRYVVGSLTNEGPSRFSPDEARRYLGVLLLVAGHEEQIVRRGAVAALMRWVGVDVRRVAQVAAGFMTDLEDDCWPRALDVLLEACRHEKERDYVSQCVTQEVAARLRDLGLEEQPEAQADRDLPARQRLVALVEAFADRGSDAAEGLHSVLLRLDDELSDDPAFMPLRLCLRLAAIRWSDVEQAVSDLTSLVKGPGESWLGVEGVSCGLVTHLTTGSAMKWVRPELMQELSCELARAPEPGLRRLSVALVSVVGPRLFWTPEAVRTLKGLRRDDDVTVRAAALGVFTAKEEAVGF